MTEDEALHLINTTPALQSILYDCGMLPEQQIDRTLGVVGWRRVLSYALAYQAGVSDERESCAKVCDARASRPNDGNWSADEWDSISGANELAADAIRARPNE